MQNMNIRRYTRLQFKEGLRLLRSQDVFMTSNDDNYAFFSWKMPITNSVQRIRTKDCKINYMCLSFIFICASQSLHQKCLRKYGLVWCGNVLCVSRFKRHILICTHDPNRNSLHHFPLENWMNFFLISPECVSSLAIPVPVNDCITQLLIIYALILYIVILYCVCLVLKCIWKDAHVFRMNSASSLLCRICRQHFRWKHASNLSYWRWMNFLRRI